MGATQQWYVACDVEGCEEVYTAEPGLELEEAQKEAEEEGWTNDGNQDFCPEHRLHADGASYSIMDQLESVDADAISCLETGD